MDTICCECRKQKIKGKWVEVDREDTPIDSHGYCPDCAKAARVTIKNHSIIQRMFSKEEVK